MKVTRFTVLLVLITLLGAFYRLYLLDLYPQHFDNDESVLAYDAWSVWHTGADHHGSVLPNYFRAFNEYLPGLAQYIDAPFVGLLGLNEIAARLPFALMGIATVMLTGLLGKRWFSKEAGLLAAALLATEPWHITFSRLTLTNSSVPFFTVLALYSFTYTVDTYTSDKRWRRSTIIWLILSALAFASLSRTYQPLKIEGPLLFAGCLLALLIQQRSSWKLVLIWAGLYLVFVSPQWIEQFIHWDLYQVQFDHNNILHLDSWPLVFLGHYLSQYDAGYLFIYGFGGGQSSHPPGIGQLFWLEGFMWLAAVVGLARRRLLRESGFHLFFLLGWWFLIWPVAAALTITGVPTETRTINFLPLPELLAGYGAAVILNIARYMRPGLRRATVQVMIGLTAVIYVGYNLYFASVFFSPPKDDNTHPEALLARPYNLGLRPVLQAVIAQATDCDPIWVDNRGTSQAYIYYLFFSQYPPEKFQKVDRYETAAPPDAFIYIPWFANVRFTDVNTILNPENFQYVPSALCDTSDHSFIIVRQMLDVPGLYEIATSKSQSGEIIWAAYRKDT